MGARLDHVIYLLMPVLQVAMGSGLVLSLFFWFFRDVPFYGGWWPTLVFFIAVALFPGFMALLMTESPGLKRLPRAALGFIPYTLYTWIVWPVFPVSLVRELFGIRGWAKTSREPLDANLPAGNSVEPSSAAGPDRQRDPS